MWGLGHLQRYALNFDLGFQGSSLSIFWPLPSLISSVATRDLPLSPQAPSWICFLSLRGGLAFCPLRKRGLPTWGPSTFIHLFLPHRFPFPQESPYIHYFSLHVSTLPLSLIPSFSLNISSSLFQHKTKETRQARERKLKKFTFCTTTKCL